MPAIYRRGCLVRAPRSVYTVGMKEENVMRYTLIGIAALVLAGCATSSTGVVAIGDGKFIVSRKAGAFPSGKEPLLAETLAEATAKCEGMGKALNVESITEASGPFIAGRYPQATIYFRCA